jgi:predicted  nucleic acid-binding Zn-ribbon protein
MEILHTPEARALADLQKRDLAIDALKARVADIPVKIKGLNAAFAGKKAAMLAAREAFLSLQSRKKDLELRIAEADEGIRKHQLQLNQVKDNAAFKALLTEIDGDKAAKDELETGVLTLLEEIDKASVQDKALQAEVKVVEDAKNTEVAGLEAAAKEAAAALAAAAAERAAAAAGIDAGLLEKYEAIRGARAGLAVAPVHEEPATGKLTCSGCHMGLTPQKAVDVKKPETFTYCPECRRLMYSEKTLYGH